MVDLQALRRDLADEHLELDDVLVGLDAPEWDRPTPAPGWAVRDQISHLAFFDEQALLATSDPDGFADALSRATSVSEYIDEPLERGRTMDPSAVLAWWRTARAAMLDAFGHADPSVRIPWFGPPMSPASFISARLMETWAHGQDIVDALGTTRTPTARLKHVAHLGVRARRNSYAANGRTMPDEEVRVDLRAPSGERWVWNADARHAVTGDALDFCLVVTQRRHPADTGLQIEGDLAGEWISIAQAFAGPPGTGREPGQFPREDA